MVPRSSLIKQLLSFHAQTAVEMAGYRKILHTFLLLSVLAKTSCANEGIKGATSKETIKKEENDELVVSESKDGQLEIVKRIKKVNRDGSYTIGYEADDGSFKIESRDVLGRVRGTYGYVDENGEVRRVTYDSGTEVVTAANLSESEEENATASSTASTRSSTSAVVQQIPAKLKRNETSNSTVTINSSTSTSRRPTYIFSSTVTTPTITANSVVQSIPKKRITSTTTTKPNYDQVVTYASATPRVLLQGGHQLVRPPQNDQSSIFTAKPTALPLSFSTVLPDENRESNILRRETEHDSNSYDVREHVYRLRQSLGHDASDVYSAGSMSTGTSRPPLFTTTHRPAIHSQLKELARTNFRKDHSVTSTARPVLTYQPATVTHPSPTHSTVAYENHSNEDATSSQSTTTPVSATSVRDPLVAVRQPDGQHAVLIPLSHLRSGYLPILRREQQHERQYEPTRNPNVVEIEQQQAVVRRLPTPLPPPLPVRVDQNGYIREATRQPSPHYVTPAVPNFIPTSRFESGPIHDDIDNIRPPVSTRDLQRLLEQLILRQSRLEKIVALTRSPSLQPKPYDQYQQPQLYHLQQHRLPPPIRQYPTPFVVDQDPDADASHQSEYAPDPESLRPTRRYARQRQFHPQENKVNGNQQYLPSDVREMLLLRMLQLAINPALPVTEQDMQETEENRSTGGGVRNVEILGEEDQEDAKQQRRLRQKGQDRYMGEF